MVSPSISITSAAAKLTFRNRWSFENSGGSFYDGGILEIAIGAGPFTEIVAAGGSFVSGGYTQTLSTCCGNPLGGQLAWAGVSTGYPAYLTTTVNLPRGGRWTIDPAPVAGGDGRRVLPRTGQNIDTITIMDPTNQCNPGPATDCDDDNPCTDDSCDPLRVACT